MSGALASLEMQKRNREALEASPMDILESTRQMRKHLDELRRLVAKPVEMPSLVAQ